MPRLKGAGLDPNDVKSYRPISNLSFVSKVIERVIFRQLVVYLDSNNVIPKFQSGFRKHHRTESATPRDLSDIYSVIDNGKIALLALLGVSAAFDTVDHDILMDWLARLSGLVGNVFDWLASFVTGRTYAVRFGGMNPPPRKVRSGIPQGLILGPLLYILYTADVAALVESLGFKVHLYANDTQLYDFCSPSDAVVLASRVNTAIKVVSCWMSSNRLCLNLDKTKYLWFGTTRATWHCGAIQLTSWQRWCRIRLRGISVFSLTRSCRWSITSRSCRTFVFSTFVGSASCVTRWPGMQECTPHPRACLRVLLTRLLQKCDVWNKLIPARSSAVDPKFRCSTYPPDPEVQLYLVVDPR